MVVLVLIGLIAIIFSFVYLVYHLIKKIKEKDLVLSKKLFFISFIGGLILVVIGTVFSDTGTASQLHDQILKNEKLLEENEKLIEDNEKLTAELQALTEKKESAEIKLQETNAKLNNLDKKTSKYKKNTLALKKEIEEFKNKVEALNKEIDKSKEENKTLETRLNELNKSEASSNSRTNSTATNPASTGENNTYYDNCTAARNAGAAPVRRGDPGYGRHLDRDGDGAGCES